MRVLLDAGLGPSAQGAVEARVEDEGPHGLVGGRPGGKLGGPASRAASHSAWDSRPAPSSSKSAINVARRALQPTPLASPFLARRQRAAMNRAMTASRGRS
jgi:hypothetical protein